ncbi:N-acetyltransferase [Streptomyces sp. NPDC023838]|uniref:GNAT family N-acetyltransferase n=1 Tax=Streptomyces sp. NPDC023838 TaxID=3154325 RepID=UPI003404016B
MSASAFVPHDFVVPQGLSGEGFRLEPLNARHNEADHAAWMSSIEHIQATPGFQGSSWPPSSGMSLEENLRDLNRHADDFAKRSSFTYSVLDDGDQVIGCVYIYPPRTEDQATQVSSWVRADRRELDGPLRDAVSAWLSSTWPFEHVDYRSGT